MRVIHQTYHLSGISRLHRAGHRESGAAMVESALVALIFFTAVFSILQLTLVACAFLDARNGASLGARRAEIVANDAHADYRILETVRRETHLTQDTQIQRVIVFWARDESSAVPPACLTANNQGVGQGVKGSACNIYQTDELMKLTEANFKPGVSDKAWPGETRNTSRSGPPDYAGVTVVLKSGGIGGLFNFQRTFTQTAVVRIQANRN